MKGQTRQTVQSSAWLSSRCRVAMKWANNLKGTCQFIKPKNLFKKRALANKLRAATYKLIECGFESNDLRIRNLKLFYWANKLKIMKSHEDIVSQLRVLPRPTDGVNELFTITTLATLSLNCHNTSAFENRTKLAIFLHQQSCWCCSLEQDLAW